MNNNLIWVLIFVLTSIFLFFHTRKKEKSHKTIATTGFILWQTVDNWIDYVVYPFVFITLGTYWGFITMFLITLVGNITYVIINNKTTADWTLIETFLKIKFIHKINNWHLKNIKIGKAILFAIITIKLDSFWALNFLYGKNVNLRNPKVIVIFLLSHLICNLGWGGLWIVIISLIKSFF